MNRMNRTEKENSIQCFMDNATNPGAQFLHEIGSLICVYYSRQNSLFCEKIPQDQKDLLAL